MTTSDYCIKWGAYGLAVIPVWLLEVLVLNRLHFLGLFPCFFLWQLSQ
mgnify:CR=1 FL=1